MKDIKLLFGKRLKQLRQFQELTQQELADAQKCRSVF